MRQIDFLKKYIIVIPILIMIFWAIYALLNANFFKYQRGYDFMAFYNAGLYIIQNPSGLYTQIYPGYRYLPVFAYLFSIFTLFPLMQAHYILFFINIILGILFILELNKIFKLIGVNNDYIRVLFISIPILTWNVYYQFYYPQVKIIVGLILLFIVRREFEWRKLNLEKSMKYYFINYLLIAFSLSIAPYFIFIYLILIIDDIGIPNLLKKQGLTKILSLIVILLLQNITLFIFPNLILDFLSGGIFFMGGTKIFYLELIWRSLNVTLNLTFVFLIPLILCNLFICFSKYDLPTKLGFAGLCYFLFNAYGTQEEFITECLLLILLVKYLQMEDNWIDIIKKNKILTFGLILLVFMNIVALANFTLFKWFPFLINLEWLVNLRLLIPVIIITISILVIPINLKRKNIPPKKLLLIQ